MTISRAELENLMRLVGSTSHREIDCEECLMTVSEFAEHELQRKPLSDVLRAVEQHLAICGECREEYDMLREALSELGADEAG
ncbi:MAG: hypothetical protein ACYC6N_12760 [Pirellulaceae bacterium]